MSNNTPKSIPDKLVLLTIEDSYRNCAVDYKSSRGLQSARKRMTSTVYDSFTGSATQVFPDELLIDNTGVTVKITDKQASSDRNGSIHIIMCDIETKGEHRMIPLESKSLLSIISNGSVHNGVLDDKIVFGLNNGIIYPHTVSQIEAMQEHKGEEARKPTSKLQVGHMYTSPMGNTREIYLGEAYSHIVAQKYGRFVWYDKPKKVFVLFEPRYTGVLSMFDNSLNGKTLDDIFHELIHNTSLKYVSGSTNMPLAIHALPGSIKLSKPARFPLGVQFKHNGHTTMDDLIKSTQLWLNNNLDKAEHVYRVSAIDLLGLCTDNSEQTLTEDEINKLVSYMPSYFTFTYHEVEYTGTRGK